MVRESEATAKSAPFARDLGERRKREGAREGRLVGKLEGFRAGKLQGKREVLLRLMARAGAIAEADRGRVALCTDAETLDRWIDDAIAGRGNVLG